ncbi:MAG: hypothetical protein KatS3mg131_3742 [Candidatus Tectimicrobiota bacterium]|nr:MAG: hypothetical protein KatS3mg131_3742 [Candidatus Tectomicrobia bacterium]
MAQLTTAELQQLARETFGRDLTAAQAEAYRGRLPVMAAAVRLLQAWEERLGESEPAAVFRLAPPQGVPYGSA